MKLSVSNIAWGPESDAAMYPVLAEKGYQGLEAAPTRLFPQRPYDHLEQAAAFRARLQACCSLRQAAPRRRPMSMPPWAASSRRACTAASTSAMRLRLR